MSQSRIVYTPTPEKRRRRSPSRRSIFLILGALGLMAIIAAVIYILQVPYLQINSIKISGMVSLDESEIRQRISSYLDGKVAMFLPRSSFFFVRSRRTEALLKDAFPRIASVSAAKIFPHGLKVEISERKLWGIFCNDFKTGVPPPLDAETRAAACAYIDAGGFAYERAPASSGLLLIKIHGDGELEIPSQAIPQELVRRMITFGEELKSALAIDAVGFEFSSQISHEFRVKTSDGFSLWINRDDEFAGVTKVLKTVLDEEIKDRRDQLEYVDLRFGNKVFYKFRQK